MDGMVVTQPSPRPVLPAPDVVVRPARPDDHAAGLVFEAAPEAYSSVAGSEFHARAAIEQLWRMPGHWASFEHALVAEVDGRLVGVLIGFPARDRYRLHLALLRKGLRFVSARRWPLVLAALPQLIAATPRPPQRALCRHDCRRWPRPPAWCRIDARLPRRVPRAAARIPAHRRSHRLAPPPGEIGARTPRPTGHQGSPLGLCALYQSCRRGNAARQARRARGRVLEPRTARELRLCASCYWR